MKLPMTESYRADILTNFIPGQHIMHGVGGGGGGGGRHRARSACNIEKWVWPGDEATKTFFRKHCERVRKGFPPECYMCSNNAFAQ